MTHGWQIAFVSKAMRSFSINPRGIVPVENGRKRLRNEDSTYSELEAISMIGWLVRKGMFRDTDFVVHRKDEDPGQSQMGHSKRLEAEHDTRRD